MLQIPELGAGYCIGVGATHYRPAEIDTAGNPIDNGKLPTPDTSTEFFFETGQLILKAHERGAEYMVIGVPGPVWDVPGSDGHESQRFRATNIKALSDPSGFDAVAEISATDPAVKRLLASRDFRLLMVNDGDLAAQAAASRYGISPDGKSYNAIANLINGSGIGAAVVRRDPDVGNGSLFHPDSGLWELGHLPWSSGLPSVTHETLFSGNALGSRTGRPITELDQSGHVIWQEVAHGMASLVLNLALSSGAELVVISGGNAIKAQRHIKPPLQTILDEFAASTNPMADKTPKVQFVPRKLEDTYELYGARGAMQSHVARQAVRELIHSA